MKRLLVWLSTFLFIILIILFQINFLDKISLFTVIPSIGVVFVSAIGIVSGANVGGFVGGTYGLLVDTFCGKALGIYFFLYLVLGVISGLFKNKMSTNNKLSLAFMVVFGTAFVETSYVLLNKIAYRIDVSMFSFLKVLLLEEIYNLILTYILFRSFMLWGEIINRSKNIYS